MKVLLTSFALFLGSVALAQTDGNVPPPPPPPPPTGVAPSSVDPDEGRVFSRVERQPQFPGGEGEMMMFLRNNVKYPKDAKKKGTQGTVFVTFVVAKSGKIEDVRIARGVSEDLDAESVRVIKAMPDWSPGQMAGKPVAVQYNIPIKFTLR